MHRSKQAGLNVCARRWITRSHKLEILSRFARTRVYFVLVVGHESGRRNWRTAPRTESGFPRSEGPAKQTRAGRAEAGGQRQGSDPRDDRSKDRSQRPPETNGLARAQWQVGLESPPVTRGRAVDQSARAGSWPTRIAPKERVLRSAKRRTQRARVPHGGAVKGTRS